MTRYVAFLRAINVGGHVVKMDHLRQIFESLGYVRVETFIASGNVVFETTSKNARSLEKKIGDRLREALGYEVVTFIRTVAEVADIARYQPFPQSDVATAAALNIAFLADALDDTSTQKLMALKTETDDFHVHEREMYWLCRRKQSESPFFKVGFEKTVGRKATVRGANTVKRIAAKYCSSKL
jgi:uncharacterized protein (DUF1697 family)